MKTRTEAYIVVTLDAGEAESLHAYLEGSRRNYHVEDDNDTVIRLRDALKDFVEGDDV